MEYPNQTSHGLRYNFLHLCFPLRFLFSADRSRTQGDLLLFVAHPPQGLTSCASWDVLLCITVVTRGSLIYRSLPVGSNQSGHSVWVQMSAESSPWCEWAFYTWTFHPRNPNKLVLKCFPWFLQILFMFKLTLLTRVTQYIFKWPVESSLGF